MIRLIPTTAIAFFVAVMIVTAAGKSPDETPDVGVAEPVNADATESSMPTGVNNYYSATGWNAGGLLSGEGVGYSEQNPNGSVSIWCKPGGTCWRIVGNQLHVYTELLTINPGNLGDPDVTQITIVKN